MFRETQAASLWTVAQRNQELSISSLLGQPVLRGTVPGSGNIAVSNMDKVLFLRSGNLVGTKLRPERGATTLGG